MHLTMLQCLDERDSLARQLKEQSHVAQQLHDQLQVPACLSQNKYNALFAGAGLLCKGCCAEHDLDRPNLARIAAWTHMTKEGLQIMTEFWSQEVRFTFSLVRG